MGNWSPWFLVLVLMFAFSAVVPELFVMVIDDVNWGVFINKTKKIHID